MTRQPRNYQSAVRSASDTFFVAIQGRNSISLIGYARVSTTETRQHLHRQLDALHVAGCERVFEDDARADPDRPKLAAGLDDLRAGDALVVLDLDRGYAPSGPTPGCRRVNAHRRPSATLLRGVPAQPAARRPCGFELVTRHSPRPRYSPIRSDGSTTCRR